METIEWWPKLDPDAQAWLIAHNGEAVTPEVLNKIAAAGGLVTSGEPWIGESGPEGFYLSDEALDWIETTANDESD
ncbi:hypothetical protein J7E83_03085 [Arthrobacter sp. ISL-48]|uniref:hypothetical protein n=1 Tax=Arthrobacter sp. ISL-48 TaxID=2819110 RepID=UPI001BE6AAAF|nr:hypothetical protein [Arthrobacter sp. ISL-48]MBT2531123.1 hypothetical protein [Arthrobacter sp. ISL-48]